ncbi:MAG TPA: hypothetical protein PKX16_10305, partial [Kiritimatiellia bacterium]|nr:hypothetical protein [Kiritimatiellia bacterium]
SAYTEFYLWTAADNFQTVEGRWRVIGASGGDTNCCIFEVRFTKFGIVTAPQPVNGLQRFDWRGGVQGLRYLVEYSDDFGQTWKTWDEKYNGPAPINRSNFIIPVGGSQSRYTFEDRTSYMRRTRWYRMWELRE